MGSKDTGRVRVQQPSTCAGGPAAIPSCTCSQGGAHSQQEELVANWEDGNSSITGGHTEPVGCCMCYTQTNSPHPELRLLSPTPLKPCVARQERAQDEEKSLDVKGNKTKIPFQLLLWQSVCRGLGATEDFILDKIREVQDFYGQQDTLSI